MVSIKIPDGTPEIIVRYAQSDEQALLAKLRYNRLLDVFLGITCSSLQSHLRTAVPGVGQIETDEVYVGIDRSGAHFVVPVQAKGPRDRIGAVQVGQDVALCRAKFPHLRCRPVAAQMLADGRIVLFEFGASDNVEVVREVHFQLVRSSEISEEDLERYRRMSESGGV